MPRWSTVLSPSVRKKPTASPSGLSPNASQTSGSSSSSAATAFAVVCTQRLKAARRAAAWRSDNRGAGDLGDRVRAGERVFGGGAPPNAGDRAPPAKAEASSSSEAEYSSSWLRVFEKAFALSARGVFVEVGVQNGSPHLRKVWVTPQAYDMEAGMESLSFMDRVLLA